MRQNAPKTRGKQWAESKTDITNELQDLKDSLNKKVTVLQTDVDWVGSRVVETESNLQKLERQTVEMPLT